MGVHILVNKEDGYQCLYCSVTMWAFGPIFYENEDAEEFLDWLKPVDPRSLTDKELENKVYEWRKIINNEICPSCECSSINTNNGDCYCAECGHKWEV